MGQALSLQEASSSSSCDAPAPHRFQEIVAGEKTAASELEDQVFTGIFLSGKTKKYWADERTRLNCFVLFPRGMDITWGGDRRYWTWQRLKEGSNDDTQIEVAVLLDVCWLEIHGKLDLLFLSPGVTYEVFFEVMLTNKSRGWSVPVTLRLKFPDGKVQQVKENLQNKPKGRWLDLKVGEVNTHQEQKGDLEISMFEYDVGLWKSGLLIKGIKILPKQ